MQDRSFDPIILLSGGIDSTSCIRFYQDLGVQPKCLFVDYGQPARTMEERAAGHVAEYYGVPLRTVSVVGISPSHVPGFVRGRNMLLLSVALSAAPTNLIVMGIHTVPAYPDCGPEFVAAAQSLLDLSSMTPVRFAAPFAGWTKNDVWAYALDKNIPLHLTRSCEAATIPPCGRCNSCRDLERLNVSTPAPVHR